MKRKFSILLSILLLFSAPAPAMDGGPRSAGEIYLALEKLNVLGAALYVGAHPDDENTGLMAYLAKGKKYRTAYLSITRGEGGQNLIGSEKGSDLGILRSQELLAARRVDGGEQFFTRAIDFGYSKSVKESLEFWGHGNTLADVVWVIRSFRPDAIVLRFPTTEGGHGHHTAGSILAVEAFSAAADPSRFPEQLKYVRPWQAKRILLNQSRFGGAAIAEGSPSVNVGTYNPLLASSYNEMAARARSMHRSQGFGSMPSSGAQMEYFRHIAGEPMEADIMEGIDVSWGRVPGGEAVGRAIGAIMGSFNAASPAASLPALLELNEKMASMASQGGDPWIKLKMGELAEIIQSCAGLRFEAFAEDYAAAPGESPSVTINIIQRTGSAAHIGSISFPTLGQRHDINQPLPDNALQSTRYSAALPAGYPISQPYWLARPEQKGASTVEDPQMVGLAENPLALPVELEATLLGKKIVLTAPVQFRWVERSEGEMRRPFEVRPPVTANFKQRVAVFRPNEEKELTVTLKSHAASAKGDISLKAPHGWRVSPEHAPFEFAKRHDEKSFTFRALPPQGAKAADIVAVASVGGKDYSYSLLEIDYPHIPAQVHFPDAALRLVPLEKKSSSGKSGKLGYIMGSGDEIPEILRDMGYDVVLLEDDMLTTETISGLDVIVAGIRAYNTRQQLKFAQPLLMDFVKNGGTYIVQYNVNTGLQAPDIGPYPFTIGRGRIVEEGAGMRFLAPSHPLMNAPNAITKEDFGGWVQERGLYFPEQWDAHYAPLFAGNDAGEGELQGSTLYCEYGDGVFVYTSLAFFRQLPEGVPGAFRLFQNMLAARKQ